MISLVFNDHTLELSYLKQQDHNFVYYVAACTFILGCIALIQGLMLAR